MTWRAGMNHAAPPEVHQPHAPPAGERMHARQVARRHGPTPVPAASRKHPRCMKLGVISNLGNKLCAIKPIWNTEPAQLGVVGNTTSCDSGNKLLHTCSTDLPAVSWRLVFLTKNQLAFGQITKLQLTKTSYWSTDKRLGLRWLHGQG